MKIIIEGPDGSGKSTLAATLADRMKLPLHVGKGPVRSELDYMARWMEYVSADEGVFDRHFVVSEAIYSQFFPRGNFQRADIIHDFYSLQPLIVYCRAPRILADHTATSPTDTPDYLSRLQMMHPRIVDAYEEWASLHPVIYYNFRGGSTLLDVLRQIERKIAA